MFFIHVMRAVCALIARCAIIFVVYIFVLVYLLFFIRLGLQAHTHAAARHTLAAAPQYIIFNANANALSSILTSRRFSFVLFSVSVFLCFAHFHLTLIQNIIYMRVSLFLFISYTRCRVAAHCFTIHL